MLECPCHVMRVRGLGVKVCVSVSATCHGASGAPFGSSILNAAQAPGEPIYSILNYTCLIVYICVPWCPHGDQRKILRSQSLSVLWVPKQSSGYWAWWQCLYPLDSQDFKGSIFACAVQLLKKTSQASAVTPILWRWMGGLLQGL